MSKIRRLCAALLATCPIGNFAGLRYDQYKAVFMEQSAHGLEVWIQPFVMLRGAEALQPAR